MAQFHTPPPRRTAPAINLKLDLENYRNGQRDQTVETPRRAGIAVNWKIVRAVGLALLVWALIGAVLLSI